MNNGITQIEHIKELQKILVQTCLDYINKHGLIDIYSLSFTADELAYSLICYILSGNPGQ